MNKKETASEIQRVGNQIDRLKRNAMARRLCLLGHHKIDLVLDVGANTGQYALSLRRSGWRGAVASFEPLQSAYRLLARRAQKDGAWTAHRLALGDRNTTKVLHVSGDSRASSLLPILPAHLAVADYFNTVAKKAVPVR